MSKVFLLTCQEKDIIKGFINKDDAVKTRKQLEDEEKGFRDMANKCRECAGLNKECPLYTEPLFDDGDICETYQPFHDNKSFNIIEVECEL